MTVSPRTSSIWTRHVLGNRGTVARARDLVHQLLAHADADLPDAARGDADDDAPDDADEIAGADFRAGLLIVEKSRQRVDGAAENQPAAESDEGGRHGRRAVVRRDGTEPAESGDEYRHHTGTEEARTTRVEVVIRFEDVEDLAERQRQQQKQEADGANRQEDRERRKGWEDVHHL